MGEEGDRKERKPVVGFGQRDIVFVRVKRVDERGKTDEQVKEELRTEVSKKLNFMSAMFRQGRVVGLLGTNVVKGWKQAFLSISDRPGKLVHAFLPTERGGRTLTAYFLNAPKSLAYEELSDEILAYEGLSASAGEKNLRMSDLLEEYNKTHKPEA